MSCMPKIWWLTTVARIARVLNKHLKSLYASPRYTGTGLPLGAEERKWAPWY